MTFSYTIPTVGVTEDPTWSTEIADALQQLKEHKHLNVAGDGALITVAALNIDNDLPISGNNIITMRSAIFQNLSSDPAGVIDVCSLYFKNGNFYANNQSGAHIQITNGSGLNISTGVANLYESTLVTSNTSILNTDTFTYIEVNTTTSKSLFLPGANTLSGGRFYYIKDISGLSETNAITLVPNGTDNIDTVNANYTLKTNFGSWLIVCDGSSNWFVSQFTNAEHNAGRFVSTGSNMLIDSKSNYLNLQSNLTNINLSPLGTISITADTAGVIITSGATGTQFNGFTDFNNITNFKDNVNVSSADIELDGYSNLINYGDTIFFNTGNFLCYAPANITNLTIGSNLHFASGTTVTAASNVLFNAPIISNDNITINSSTFTMSGGTLDINGATVNFDASTTFEANGTSQFNAGLYVYGFGLYVDGICNLANNVTVSGNLIANLGTNTFGISNFSGATQVNSTLGVTGLISGTAGASIPWRQLAVPNTSSHSYVAHNYEYVSIDTLSGTLNLTIDDTNAVNGDHHVIENFSNQSVNVIIPGPSTLFTMGSGAVTPTYAYMVRRAGVWTFVNKG